MSEQNVETVRRCIKFWDTQDFAALTELADPEFVLDLSENFNPVVYEGIDGLRRWMADADEMWEEFRIEAEELIDAGEQVVTCAHVSGKGRGSGAPAEMRVFQVWKLGGGKVLRITGGYRDRAQALSAAGLRE
jgi:ketosteroid isomerase-like protein